MQCIENRFLPLVEFLVSKCNAKDLELWNVQYAYVTTIHYHHHCDARSSGLMYAS